MKSILRVSHISTECKKDDEYIGAKLGFDWE